MSTTDRDVLPNNPDRPLSSGQRAKPNPAETMLELVSETVEPVVDSDAIHHVIAALLLRYHRTQASGVARVL